jgi:iron(III) transport system ATP-binding protein
LTVVAPAPAGDLVISDLHKAFGAHPVLAGLDLTVPAGSFTSVLGPSGSGKTTLLRVLAGFERPDRGRVAIGGTTVDDDRSHVPAERRRTGYVSQEGSLFPHLTVAANVGFGLPRRQRGSDVADLLDAVGLGGLGGRYPHQLSGGQQQRVALARALAVRPQVVLLDEPFAALDATLRASVRADVQSVLREAGATTVLVTHDQDEALSMSDQVAVIRLGRIAQLGPPQYIYAHPADSELACFVGDANLVEGVFDGQFADTPLGRVPVDDSRRQTAPGPVTVLVRPEQVQLLTAPGAAGAPARVMTTAFYGHDAVVHLRLDDDGGRQVITARALGELRLSPGTAVRVTAKGPVRVWPAAAGSVPAAHP